MDPFSEPLRLTVQVVTFGSLCYVLSGHGGHNLAVDMGRQAVVKTVMLLSSWSNVAVPASSPLLYEAAGLRSLDYRIVVAKSPEGFCQDYEPFCSGILYCAATGCTTPFLRHVLFHRVSRPLYPLDAIDNVDVATWAGEMADR